jgi:hypothetical protein
VADDAESMVDVIGAKNKRAIITNGLESRDGWEAGGTPSMIDLSLKCR